MSYTKDYIIGRLKEDISNNMSSLYQQDYVNFSGTTTDSSEYYYDVIADCLLKNQSCFEAIEKIHRGYSYKTESHRELTEKEKRLIAAQLRGEDWFAKSLLNSEFDHIGKIIDYQTPVKGNKYDERVGKIDLLAYKKETDMLSVIELKLKDNKDTMLHTILQVCTYYLQINRKKLREDFGFSSDGDKIQKVALIFKDSPQYVQYKESVLIRKLAEELSVNVLTFDTVITTISTP